MGSTTYTYDAAGRRITSTTAGVTTIYTWKAPGDRLVDVSRGGSSLASMLYGPDGQRLIRRTVQGRLTSTTATPGGTTSNYYDTDRQRILRKTPDGTTTLYLAGLMEVVDPPGAGAVQVTRFYSIAGSNVAYRRNTSADSGVTYLAGNHQGSPTAALNRVGGTHYFQLYHPYGATRYGSLPSTDHAFLNQTKDASTGLNYLNNRYHDPATGVFISVDPLVAGTGEAYLYASGNPTTLSDPSGLAACEDDGNCPWSAGQSCSRACTGPGGAGRQGDAAGSSADTPLLEWALNYCAGALGICQRDVAERSAGGHMRIAVDFLLSAQDAGLLVYRNGLLYSVSVTGDLSGSMSFSTDVSNGSLAIALVTADLPSAGWEDALSQVGTIFNVVEVGALALCGTTGAACPAIPFVSGASTALDAANLSVDGWQHDWGEFVVGGANLAGGQLVGLGARGWVAPTSAMSYAGPIGARAATTGAPLGTSAELFQAYVGGAFKGSIMAAEGSLTTGGQTIPYQLFQMTYAL